MDRAGRTFVGAELVSAVQPQHVTVAQIMPTTSVRAACFTCQVLMLPSQSGNEINAGVEGV